MEFQFRGIKGLSFLLGSDNHHHMRRMLKWQHSFCLYTAQEQCILVSVLARDGGGTMSWWVVTNSFPGVLNTSVDLLAHEKYTLSFLSVDNA